MRKARINMRDYFVLPHPQLKSYLERQVIGSSEVLMTPIWDGRSIDDVLDEWEGILQRTCANYPALLQFEADLRAKVGPMSVQKPLAERYTDIEAYYDGVAYGSEPIDPSFIDLCWRNRFQHLRQVPMFDTAQVLEQMRKNTNSGNPYFTRRGIVIDRGLVGSTEFVDGKWVIHTPDGDFRPAAILGWRGQEGGPTDEDVKQRVLWMFSMAMNIREAQVYAPLISACQRNRLMPTWMAQKDVDATMTRMFDTKDPADIILGTDFTKFDQHFNSNLSSCALSLIQRMMAHDEAGALDNWSNAVFPFKYYTPLVTRWGEATFGDHGMASGSGGTNADETLAHSVLQYEAAATADAKLNPYSMCLGDDGVLTYPGIRVEHVLDTYTKHGLVMNPDKQEEARDHAVFLRRLYAEELRGKDGIIHGIYSGARAIGRIKMLERRIPPKYYGPSYIIIRSLSILENLEYHPARIECLELVRKGDAYGLGTNIPHFFDSGNFTKTVAEAAAHGGLGWQYISGLNPKPATSWWTYKYLKSLV